jgi:hypothetical protein
MKTDCSDCVWIIQGRVIKDYKPCEVCKRDTLNDHKITIDKDGEWHWPETRYYCHRCGKDMRARAVHPEREWLPDYDDHDLSEELVNEFNLICSGGYGSFIDDLGDMPTVTICHECGHHLCDLIGVDPRLWHTHSIYGGQHEDHHDNQALYKELP